MADSPANVLNIRTLETPNGSLRFDPNDSPIGLALHTYGEWGESELEVLTQLIRPGDTILDIGANYGTHTLNFAARTGPTGTVRAFEKNRDRFRLLEENIRQNNLHWVHADSDSLANPKCTIDSLGLGVCRLIHLDADGEDLKVLRGGAETLKRLRPFVFAENNDEAQSPELLSLLFGAHYRLFWHFDFAFRKNNPNGRSDDIFGGAFDVNVLAIPEEKRVKLNNFTAVENASDSWRAALERSNQAG